MRMRMQIRRSRPSIRPAPFGCSRLGWGVGGGGRRQEGGGGHGWEPDFSIYVYHNIHTRVRARTMYTATCAPYPRLPRVPAGRSRDPPETGAASSLLGRREEGPVSGLSLIKYTSFHLRLKYLNVSTSIV